MEHAAMTNAELIGLAALVQASCTEISAANADRAAKGDGMAYDHFQDLYGDRASEDIVNEVTRRQRIRDIEREFETAKETCMHVGTKHVRHCQLTDKHEGPHAAVFEQYGEKVFAEWQRSADEPKLAAPGEDIPF